uniref:Uncharacterized protein n=1 Tax=Neisseria meningitidis alpha275 TaxID=295996 RepID=C6SLA7_NEIME|nr:hypothetical protein predicted by Glimmer/Critica [Neisseria meningitidis alpha275]
MAFSIFLPRWEMPRPTALPPFLTASLVLSQPFSTALPVCSAARSAAACVLSRLRAVSCFAPSQVPAQADKARADRAVMKSLFMVKLLGLNIKGVSALRDIFQTAASNS